MSGELRFHPFSALCIYLPMTLVIRYAMADVDGMDDEAFYELGERWYYESNM